jgi:dihydroorotate dehydrogenase electron transfer subunit
LKLPIRDGFPFSMSPYTPSANFASAPHRVGGAPLDPSGPDLPAGECLSVVVSNVWVNDEYKLMVLNAPPKALTAKAGQFFQLLCPSPEGGELWLRRPMSIYAVDPAKGQLRFLYKCVGRGTLGMARLEPGDEFNIAGPFGVGFSLEPGWRNIVVLGRGVGLATMAPISQLADAHGIGITAILSARDASLAMSADLFEAVGADIIEVTDSDGTSALDNVEAILEDLIARDLADAFFTCGSNRLLLLMKRLGQKHGIPGQVAMEQVMACGLGPCYVCVRTFEVDGEKVLRRVCIEGPVFDIQETVGW